MSLFAGIEREKGADHRKILDAGKFSPLQGSKTQHLTNPLCHWSVAVSLLV